MSENNNNNNNNKEKKEEKEFINHGYIRWEQQRKEWNENTNIDNNTNNIEINGYRSENIMENLCANPPEPFDRPIPLAHLISVLEDLWEVDGKFIA